MWHAIPPVSELLRAIHLVVAGQQVSTRCLERICKGDRSQTGRIAGVRGRDGQGGSATASLLHDIVSMRLVLLNGQVTYSHGL